MTIDFSILRSPDIGSAMQAGLQSGREMKRQQVMQSALSAFAQNPLDEQAANSVVAVNPEMGLRLKEYQQKERSRGILSSVFSTDSDKPAPPLGQPSALSGTMTRPGLPAAQSTGLSTSSQPAAVAPSTLVDPSALPPRTDGVKLNHRAMRALFADDPATAMKIQQMVFDADEASFKRMATSGKTMASVAWHLGQFKSPDGSPDIAGRQAELQAMAPMLATLGITPDMVAQADLTDQGLRRYFAIGRNIGGYIKLRNYCGTFGVCVTITRYLLQSPYISLNHSLKINNNIQLTLEEKWFD